MMEDVNGSTNVRKPIIFTKFFTISWTEWLQNLYFDKMKLSFIKPIMVNYLFIVTHLHRKNLPQNAA